MMCCGVVSFQPSSFLKSCQAFEDKRIPASNSAVDCVCIASPDPEVLPSHSVFAEESVRTTPPKISGLGEVTSLVDRSKSATAPEPMVRFAK